MGPGAVTMALNVPMYESAVSHGKLPCPAQRRPYCSTFRLPRQARSSAFRRAHCGARLPRGVFVRTTLDDAYALSLPSFGVGSRPTEPHRRTAKSNPLSACRAADPCSRKGSLLLSMAIPGAPASTGTSAPTSVRSRRPPKFAISLGGSLRMCNQAGSYADLVSHRLSRRSAARVRRAGGCARTCGGMLSPAP